MTREMAVKSKKTEYEKKTVGLVQVVTGEKVSKLTLTEPGKKFKNGTNSVKVNLSDLPKVPKHRVLRLHALVPWVQIDVPGAPGGTGWIFGDVIEISGDTSQTPVTDAIQFAVPELTPTPQTVIVSGAPWNGAPLASGALATTLG